MSTPKRIPARPLLKKPPSVSRPPGRRDMANGWSEAGRGLKRWAPPGRSQGDLWSQSPTGPIGQQHVSSLRAIAALACTAQAESWFLCSILERGSRLAPTRFGAQWLNGHYRRCLAAIRSPLPPGARTAAIGNGPACGRPYSGTPPPPAPCFVNEVHGEMATVKSPCRASAAFPKNLATGWL